MHIRYKVSVCFLLFLQTAGNVAESKSLGNIELTITNIRSNKGLILISLFNQPGGFPTEGENAFKTFIIEADFPKTKIVIPDLPPGEYAIAVVHDENRNHELDTNFLGAPVEGYAASGSNKRFSAPKFESSKFTVRSGVVLLEISLRYLF